MTKKERIKEAFLIGAISGVVSAITLVILFFIYVNVRELYDEWGSTSTITRENNLDGIVCRFPPSVKDSLENTDSIH